MPFGADTSDYFLSVFEHLVILGRLKKKKTLQRAKTFGLKMRLSEVLFCLV